MVILIFTSPFDIFLSFPVRKLVVHTYFSDFVYHFAKTNIAYSLQSLISLVSIILLLIQYIFAKINNKNILYGIFLVIAILTGINDFGVIHKFINNIMITEYFIFAAFSLIFVEFLKEDRKAYHSLINSARELELKVEERTREVKEKSKIIEIERDKSDRLLLNVLPETIAMRLKKGETTIADHFDDASVIFIDVADFTVLNSKSTPQVMVKMLNEILTIFDKIASKYGIEKIKTIGDCYMAASGIPIPRTDHAHAIALMAMEAMVTMKEYRTDDGIEIKFRIGLDCGQIVAGVIGEQKFLRNTEKSC